MTELKREVRFSSGENKACSLFHYVQFAFLNAVRFKEIRREGRRGRKQTKEKKNGQGMEIRNELVE